MSTLADLLNAPGELTFEGRTYQLRQPTVMDMALFARWLEQRARESVARATDLDDDTRRRLLADVTADVAAGVYEWGGDACCKALQTPRGQSRYLAIVLKDQGLDEATADRLIEQRLQDVLHLIQAAATDDPKALAAALSKLGLPPDFVSLPPSTRPSRGPSRKSRKCRSRN